MTTRVLPADENGITEAVRLLQDGQCVALPTETVYGLAANATSQNATQSIFTAKGRPAQNPLIVHVQNIAEAQKLIVMNDTAHKLAARYWPGPLTIIGALRDDASIAANVTAKLNTLAVRVPAHPVFQSVLKACGFPLAAPSANASGTLSPTTPQIVASGLKNKIPLILAGGITDKGLESTIVDCNGDQPILLRYGAIPKDDIASLIGDIVDGVTTTDAPKSPGQMLRHYAPNTPVRLNAVDVESDEALLAFGNTKFMGIRQGGFAKDLPPQRFKNLSEGGDLDEAAHNLFAHLFALDQSGAKTIAVMGIPDTGVGVAINDRLRRACQAQKTI